MVATRLDRLVVPILPVDRKVTETEEGDEESYYEVELTLDDGSQVDVQLDRDLNVVGQSADSENHG